ncbi:MULTISPECIES: hypothetical protein [unclassified Mycobacterium]|uniref:hypothetical protein n=1 Tax=unclassified Mycobacterium TaxID=2642494 RepID=UPI0029C628BD|nr:MULTISPECIES: hypothetical protein [unclassified Mycobacterium]
MPANVATARTRRGIAAAQASAYGPPADHPATAKSSRPRRIDDLFDQLWPVDNGGQVPAVAASDSWPISRDEVGAAVLASRIEELGVLC